MDKHDPDAVQFYHFLQLLHDGKNNSDDWTLFKEKSIRYFKGNMLWKQNGFDDTNCIHLYSTNADVQNHNAKCLKQLQNPNEKLK